MMAPRTRPQMTAHATAHLPLAPGVGVRCRLAVAVRAACACVGMHRTEIVACARLGGVWRGLWWVGGARWGGGPIFWGRSSS